MPLKKKYNIKKNKWEFVLNDSTVIWVQRGKSGEKAGKKLPGKIRKK
jgi:hypothetical protein